MGSEPASLLGRGPAARVPRGGRCRGPAGRRAWGPEPGLCLCVGGFGRVSNDIAVTPWLTSRFRYLFHSQNCVDAYPTFLVVLWCAGLLCSQGEVLPSVCSLLSLTGAAVQAPRREAVPGLPLRSGKPWRGDRLRATCPAALCPPGGAVMRG